MLCSKAPRLIERCPVFGEIQQQGTHDRHSRLRRFPERGVYVGKQVITQLDGTAVDFLEAISEGPRFQIARAAGMGPAKGRENSGLQPASVKLRAGNRKDAANIGPGELESGKPHGTEHGNAQAQMVPGSPVIATPLRRVALPARVGGAGDNQGSLVGAHAQHPVAGGDGLEHSIHIVNLGMRRPPHVGVVDSI